MNSFKVQLLNRSRDANFLLFRRTKDWSTLPRLWFVRVWLLCWWDFVWILLWLLHLDWHFWATILSSKVIINHQSWIGESFKHSIWGVRLQLLIIDNFFFFFGAGLVISPHASEITFNRSDPANYRHYIQQLHKLLQSEFNTTTCAAEFKAWHKCYVLSLWTFTFYRDGRRPCAEHLNGPLVAVHSIRRTTPLVHVSR